MRLARPLVLLVILSAAVRPLSADDVPGHSRHGSAFDTGLRQRPWRMEGIGHTHFPITTKVPEVQVWFDQGNTLLHSFWFEEAERSFRWCLKLDPDCAMAYWGLARCGLNWFTRGPVDTPETRRYLDFLKEAVRRKESVTPRERMYVEAWATAFTGDGKERMKTLSKLLEPIVLQHPADVEAKALYALFSIGLGNSIGNELVLRQVFEKEPDHPGAHHYRIHTWDRASPAEALRSCEQYGLVAPQSGHANHMPGHIYSKIGMWHEAAFSMDRATRVELKYMNERLALPFESWNYSHNRNYLCHIQEQLGMPSASLEGARDLLAAPRDPEKNKDGSDGDYDQGITALVRALLRFERWDEVLKPGAIPWRDGDADKGRRAFAETIAYVGQGRLVDARDRLEALKAGAPTGGVAEMRALAAEGLVRAAEGDLLEATRLITAASAIEKRGREVSDFVNDPPDDPWTMDRLLGEVLLRHGDHSLALLAFERALKTLPSDAFALAGRARAAFALGDREKAKRSAGRLLHVWSNAEPGLRWRAEVDALGLDATAIAETPAPERSYRPDALKSVGPIDWEPYAAPALDGLDADGVRVRLEDFRGRNVLLVFFLSDECAHCVEQLVALNGRAAEWNAENTVMLAMNGAPPERNKGSQKLGGLAIRLLSDPGHENARRFASYDDFEELELHSTIVIDSRGRVQWKRTGGDPFTDVDFLLRTIKKVNAAAGARS